MTPDPDNLGLGKILSVRGGRRGTHGATCTQSAVEKEHRLAGRMTGSHDNGGEGMGDLSITLDSRYTATSGRVFLSGTQALVRLPMLQRMRDEAAGLNTAGFVSGYRGSPLGGLDQALWKAGTPRRQAHRLPAGGQRGPRGDGRLGYPATQSFSWCQDTMASSPCGTARGPGSTAAATSFATPTLPVRRSTAGSW
jgi:hypothetical protein